MSLLLALFLLLEAVFEGLRTGGYLLASELVEMVYLAGVIYLAFAYFYARNILSALPSFIRALIGCIFLRFALFDIIWNISAGQDLLYYGTVKAYDRFMASLGSWGWMMKGVAGIWGIAWLTKWGNK